jgi:3-dehydroquinate dehydratase/shikimate dehydrogenase
MTYLAVAISASDTQDALAIMHQAAGSADLAELRLDLMSSFDLEQLLEERPLPVIVTCRPARQGGRWQGGEAQRLALLRQATLLGTDYMDLEWDAVEHVDTFDLSRTRLILSYHDFQGMPDLRTVTDQLWAAQPDIVKVVGTAQRLADALPVLEILEKAVAPTIAIAMGPSGMLTRVMAFRYRQAFLSFASPDGPRLGPQMAPLLDEESLSHQDAGDPNTPPEAGFSHKQKPKGTAPGQITVSDMREIYRVQALNEETIVIGWLGSEAQGPGPLVDGNTWLANRHCNAIMIPLHLAPTEVLTPSLAALAQLLPLAGCLMAPDGATGSLRALALCTGQERQRSVTGVATGLQWILSRAKGMKAYE